MDHDAKRIERVAKALCVTDGKDPNALVPGEGPAVAKRVWYKYRKEAGRLVAAFDAARISDEGADE